jgi:hypothetical protein
VFCHKLSWEDSLVLLGGAPISVSVIRSSAEYLWRWYSYASAFGSLAEWAAETADAAAVTADAAEVTAHAAAVTAVVLETVEAAAETDHALETVDALELETVALAASNSEARSIPFAKERYFSWHLQVQQSPHLHLQGGPASAARRWD